MARYTLSKMPDVRKGDSYPDIIINVPPAFDGWTLQAQIWQPNKYAVIPLFEVGDGIEEVSPTQYKIKSKTDDYPAGDYLFRLIFVSPDEFKSSSFEGSFKITPRVLGAVAPVGALEITANISEGDTVNISVDVVEAVQGPTGPPGTTDYNDLDNRPTLGTAAAQNVETFATAAQGVKADSALQVSDIVNNLTTNDPEKPASAAQAMVLKGFIDTINNILASDDVSLDQLQEIVNYIKENREDLESLSISSVIGLQSALNNLQASIDTKAAQSSLLTKQYVLPRPTGIWMHDCYWNGSAALTNGRILFKKLEVSAPITISDVALSVLVEGSEGAVIRIGIFKAGADTKPKILVADLGTVDATTTGTKQINSLSILLTEGLYFFGVVLQGSPSTAPKITWSHQMAEVSNNRYGNIQSDVDAFQFLTQAYYYYVNFVFGALSDITELSGASTIQIPFIAFKLS